MKDKDNLKMKLLFEIGLFIAVTVQMFRVFFMVIRQQLEATGQLFYGGEWFLLLIPFAALMLMDTVQFYARDWYNNWMNRNR